MPEVDWQKSICVLSDDKIIYDAINDNQNLLALHKLYFYSSLNTIAEEKIDLLIIDKNIKKSHLKLFRIDNIVNLTSQRYSQTEIFVKKPLKLEKLLQIARDFIKNNYLFCCINNDLIYHERNSKISSSKEEIFFTQKENQIFAELLKSKNFSIDRELLKEKIWQYHKDSESSTFETHLYKLRQKLPPNIIDFDSMSCYLRIEKLL